MISVCYRQFLITILSCFGAFSTSSLASPENPPEQERVDPTKSKTPASSVRKSPKVTKVNRDSIPLGIGKDFFQEIGLGIIPLVGSAWSSLFNRPKFNYILSGKTSLGWKLNSDNLGLILDLHATAERDREDDGWPEQYWYVTSVGLRYYLPKLPFYIEGGLGVALAQLTKERDYFDPS